VRQDERVELLIGEGRPDLGSVSQCNAATTLTAWSFKLGQSVIMAITCKRWRCRFCGPQKVRKLAAITRDAAPTTLITLTVNPKCHHSPHDAWRMVQPKIARLVAKIRRNQKEFEYLRVLEATKKGWPHWHFVARTGWIEQRWLSNEWDALTGARIVDIRRIKQQSEVYWYVVKYLAKQTHIRWTDRRVTITKKFSASVAPKPKGGLILDQFERHNEHPEDYIRWNFEGRTIYQVSPICWTLSPVSCSVQQTQLEEF